MEYYRSKSCGDGRTEMESYYGYGGERKVGNGYVGVEDLRCYSASYATSTTQQPAQMPRQLKKGKSTNGSMSSSKAAVWCFSDPELQRKKRVASYKAYSVEGKIKRSFSKSIRWIKDRYTNMLHGWSFYHHCLFHDYHHQLLLCISATTPPPQKKIKKMKIQLVEFGQVSVFLGKCSEPSAMLWQ